MKKKENQLDPKFIDELAKKYTNPEDIFGKDGLFRFCRNQQTKAV